MDGLALVTQQLAQRDAAVGAARADPMQVAEFERLMQEANTDQSAPDIYTPRTESPMDAVSDAMWRTGKQISANFLEKSAAALGAADSANTSDPMVAMDRLLQVQQGLMHASFQLQFTTSLVESANKGISSLFHMQG